MIDLNRNIQLLALRGDLTHHLIEVKVAEGDL